MGRFFCAVIKNMTRYAPALICGVYRVLGRRIMWNEFATAMCLVLVIEGIIPFLYPQRWRGLVATLATMDDRQIRFIGLVSMLVGTGILMLIR